MSEVNRQRTHKNQSMFSGFLWFLKVRGLNWAMTSQKQKPDYLVSRLLWVVCKSQECRLYSKWVIYFLNVSSVLCVQLHNLNFLTISVLPVNTKCPESKENIKEMKRKDKNTKKERNESLVLLAKTEKSKCQSDLSDFDRRQKDQTNTQHQTDSQVWNQICEEHIWVTFHPKTKWEYFA